MFRLLKHVFGTPARPAARRTARPGLETLGQRDVPTSTISLNNGWIKVQGYDYYGSMPLNDRVEVRLDTRGTSSAYDDLVNVKHISGYPPQELTCSLYVYTSYGWVQQVKGISFDGRAGDDQFYNFTHLPSQADGGAGADQFSGGWGKDTFVGGTGNDTLRGGSGDDVLRGGLGHDKLWGDAGDDYLTDVEVDGEFWWEGGDDELRGGTGQDTLEGYSGADYLAGGDDGVADVLRGGSGGDRFEQELYSYRGYYFNRDKPDDFSWADGDYWTDEE